MDGELKMIQQIAESQVVIYGGGVAGAVLAKTLAPNYRITLVDPNEYFEVPMAVPRSLVKPEFADRAIIPFAEALPGVQHVRGTLIELGSEGGLIQLVDGRKKLLKGRVTVLATGSSFSNSLMRAIGGASVRERKDFFAIYGQRLAESHRILIVGGGPIGVEVAGEITELYPHKSVTIVESGPRLIRGTSEAAAIHAANVLSRRGVELLMNERLQRADGSNTDVLAPAGEAVTERGRRIPYDLLIWCVGGTPNTEYMKSNFVHTLNSAGRIRVSPELLIAGSNSIFALGDITDLDENKMAWHIDSQVKNAAHNIRAVLGGNRDAPNLKIHKPQTGNPMMAITLGSRNGVLHLPVVGVVRSSTFARIAKAGHMLVPKFRKALGV
jgi:apoptosis-inducing factor 2